VGKRRLPFVTLVAGATLAGAAMAQTAMDEEVPDEEFLEFLGAWADGDEDWVAIAIELAGIGESNETGIVAESVEMDDENE
jgi:hypothetical protein